MNKQKGFMDGIRWIDVGRNAAARKKYLGEIMRVIPIMSKLPLARDKQYQLFSYLMLQGVMPGSKIFFRRVVNVLLEIQPEIAMRLIAIEVYGHGTRRFNIDKILAWMDDLAQPHCWSVIHIMHVLDALQARKIRVETGKILGYCKALFLAFEYRAAGNLLLARKLHLDETVLKDGDILRWTDEAARKDDHGIFRMWPILLCRIKNHRRISRRAVHSLARVLLTACTERDDRGFTIEHLIGMSRESLRPNAYRRLLQEYKTLLRAHYRDEIREMRKHLRTGE